MSIEGRRGAVRLRPFLFALIASLTGRLLLLMAAGVAHRFGVASARLSSFTTGHWWLDCWAYWDSGWYLQLAWHGYPTKATPWYSIQWYAFFPGYPAAVRLFASALRLPLTLSSLMAVGFAVSFVCAVLATYLFYQLSCQKIGASAGRFATLAFGALPGSFFLSAAYSESLFILFVLLTFHYCDRAEWGRASAACAVATFTRPIGIILTLVLAYRYVAGIPRTESAPSRNRGGIWIALSPAGLMLFSLYCWLRTGQPLAWSLSERLWGRYPDWPWVALQKTSLLFSTPGQLARIPFLPSVFLDAASLLLFVLLALLLRRLMDLSYSLFVWLNLAIILCFPVHDHWPWESAKRYVLPLFPCFMVLGLWLNKRKRLAWLVLFLFLLAQCYFFVAFGLGRWVT